MTFNELLDIRKYLVSASIRLTNLDRYCGFDTFDTTDQWIRFGESWSVVKAFMDAHPELPYVC